MDNNIKQDAFMQGLEQAAQKYADDQYGSTFCSYDLEEAFISGGKWMAQQIYNAIKVTCEK